MCTKDFSVSSANKRWKREKLTSYIKAKETGEKSVLEKRNVISRVRINVVSYGAGIYQSRVFLFDKGCLGRGLTFSRN